MPPVIFLSPIFLSEAGVRRRLELWKRLDELTRDQPVAPPNPARASQFNSERHRRRVGEPSR